MSQGNPNPNTTYLRRWKPGESGNPGGRNKMDPALKKKIRDMSPELFERLRELAFGNDSPASAVSAIKLLLAYAWGSPDSLLPDDEDGPDAQSVDLTTEERRALARMALSTERRDPDPDAN